MLSFKKTLFGLVMMIALVVGVNVDAGLTKTIDGNIQYQNNGLIQYSVSYINTGSQPITVQFSDTLPSSLMPLPGGLAVCNGVVSPGPSFVISQNLQTLFTNYCILQPGQEATMSYSVLILSQSFNTISNTVNANLYSGAVVVGNETASATFSSFPVLSLEKSFTGSNPQQLGDVAIFNITISNNGSAVANNIVLDDAIPNGFQYVSSTIPGTPSINAVTNTVSWVIPTIPANTTITYTIVTELVTSIPGAGLNVGSTVTNTATIATGSTTIPSYVVFGSGGNVSSSIFTIAGVPFVTLNKNIVTPVDSILVTSGSNVSYSIVVTNTGNETAIGTITDILPPELTGFSASVLPSFTNGNTWTWTGISLAPGASMTITIDAILGSNYQSNMVFTNTAFFSYAPNTPTGPFINNGTVTGLIMGLPNLVLNKNLVSFSPNGQSGDIVVYQLTITNSSLTSFTGSRCLLDTFPSQLTLISSSLPQSNCGSISTSQISFSGNNLPATILLTGVLNTDLSSGTIITNSGSISLQTGIELLYVDNDDSVSFTIGGVDLALNKIVGATTYTGTPGTIVTYTLQYGNNGTVPVSGAVLTDVLPSNLLYSTSSVSGAILSGSNISWNLGTLLPGQSGSIILTTLISGYVEGGTITNTATLTSSAQEVNIDNNTSSASFTVTPALADIEVVKSLITQGTYASGSQYTFRFDVANIGGLNATGIQVTDILPNIFTYISGSTNLSTAGGATVGWTNTSNTITSDMFSLSAGQSGYIYLTVVLNNNILTSINYINTGTIVSATTDASLLNNVSAISGTITAPVISCSGLNYTITPNSPLLNPVGLNTLSGVSVGYTYTFTNNLALPIESLTIGTTWPSQVSTPTGLNAGIVATASNIPVGSGVSYNLLGTTIVDGVSILSTPATFTVQVAGGQSFTCNISSTITVSQACGNNIINTNLGEQCENYNGTVLVAPGIGFNPTTQACDASCKIKTTKITNCAYMDVAGTIKNACVDTTSPLELPVLTIKKYVNNQDAQDNNTAVSTSQGSTVNYRVVITNTSSFTAYNVRFSDVVPNGVTYVPNSVSPTNISYNASTEILSGNLGNLSAGSSVTITFNATVDDATNGYVNNIASVNYTDSLGTTKPELSDPAVITLGLLNNTCNNGIKEGSEQCDFGNLPRTIGNYLDSTTNFPSNSNKGKLCTSTCQISNTASRCGDGIVGRLEQCDLGNNSNTYNGGTIGSYLDIIGQSLPSGIYAGKYCTSSCIIDAPDAPAAPACRYTDTVISVMKDEIFPFSRDVELGEGKVISNENQCNTSNAGAIIEDSLECVFEIYNKNEEATNGLSLRKQVSYGCKVDQWADYKLFKPLYGTENALFAEKPRGTYKITLDNSILNGNYGEYKLSLEKVKYKYCDGNGRVVAGNPYARVCQVNFAVTDHYLMQKGSVSNKTNSDLSRYYMLDGVDIYRGTDLDKVNKISSLNITNISSTMKTLTNNLIAKYEKIAVSATLSDNEVKKVPGKSIYIMNGGKTFRGNDLTVPTTIIVKGDVNIEGNVSSNILLIATGKVRFTLPTPDKWIDSCTTQVVNGIVVAQGGFASTPNNGYKNINLNNPRCRKGNLQVYGVLVGNNLDDLINSRRSHLEHWFTFKRNGSTITVNDSDIKAERRDEIYKGASVYIEQNPSLWRDMPPGADEFLKTLNVSRS